MFKLTGNSGYRRGGGGKGGAGPRVSVGGALKHTTPDVPGPRRTAFLPDTPQESGFDSDGPRMGGLEKIST